MCLLQTEPFEKIEQNITLGLTFNFVRNQWITPKHFKNVILADPCVYCGGKAEGRDHIRAAIKSGADGWHNRAPACSLCDRAKSSKSLIWYLLRKKEAIGNALRPLQGEQHKQVVQRMLSNNSVLVSVRKKRSKKGARVLPEIPSNPCPMQVRWNQGDLFGPYPLP